MFKSYFGSSEWALWAWGGLFVICAGTWYQVQLDVQINEWFGVFFDLLQRALDKPGSTSEDEYDSMLFSFAKIAGIYVVVAVMLGFFTKHWCFRWRTAMNGYYIEHWPNLRHIEGASQRVQEDTRRFAMITESLGASLLESLMTLFAFLPMLWQMSEVVKTLPIVGEMDHALVYLTVIWAIFGTILLAIVGIRLPGLEFNNQLVEAAYRKELVFGEDRQDRASPSVVEDLFEHIRENYFSLFLNFMYFDIAKWSYLQFGVVVPYFALGPTIVSGAITLGQMQQTARAFGRVEGSFQFLVRSWATIVELISIFIRLRKFGSAIDEVEDGEDDEDKEEQSGTSEDLLLN